MDNLNCKKAIGIFDSGIGGLTVLKQLLFALPHETFIYLGDTARVPYGNKSPETITRYSIENTRALLDKSIKLLVVACNTASAYALETLQQSFDIPIVGVIEAGAEEAVSVSRSQRIGVLGTRGTIASGAYQNAIRKHNSEAFIVSVACPLFVPLVEEQWFDHPASHLIAQEYLKPLLSQHVDTLLLGCTHYPMLTSLIQEIMGSNIQLVDSASTCSQQVASLLSNQKLLSKHKQGADQYFVSDDPEKFRSLGEYILGRRLETVELLTLCTEQFLKECLQ